MSVNHETSPHQGKPNGRDPFDAMTEELSFTMEDPYVTEKHKEARRYEALLQEPGVDSRVTREQFAHQLDTEWDYIGKPVEISGKIWRRESKDGPLRPYMYVGQKLISLGFSFLDAATEGEDSSVPKVCHVLQEIPKEGSDLVEPPSALLLLDDLVEFNLPEPSPDARERRFAYYHQDIVENIDEIIKNPIRYDQIISKLRAFQYDADLSCEDGVEELHDAEEYLRRQAELEPLASYRISMLGTIIAIDDIGNHVVQRLKMDHIITAHINDVILMPTEVNLASDKKKRSCEPYIDVTAFLENGLDTNILVPCSSITLIHSVRYNGAP